MLLYSSDIFELHNTRTHSESVARIVHVNGMLRERGWLDRLSPAQWEPASREQMLRNHDPAYLDKLEHWCDGNVGRIEVDTVVSSGSWTAARQASGAVCDAVARVMTEDDPQAFCAIRPPGHHCLRGSAMGFCLLNNIAIGALQARALGAERVLIIDWDVHHGNGTQAAFWDDPSVGFLSIHRFPFYPGTGRSDETGAGRGIGTTVNIPVKADIEPSEFLSRLQFAGEKMAQELRPELILLSAGFDAHYQDPVGGLTLDVDHFQQAGAWIAELANQYCEGRIVSVLEGGYHLQFLPECVDAHLTGLTAEHQKQEQV